TGGQHRSVYMARRLYEYLRESGNPVQLRHRELP
ncbi:MAG: RNase adapter RapZ, partial [Pseudomonadota bacterium]